MNMLHQAHRIQADGMTARIMNQITALAHTDTDGNGGAVAVLAATALLLTHL